MIVAIVFLVYDLVVQRRNQKVVANAAQTNAIVTTLFPGSLGDKMIAEQEKKHYDKYSGARSRLKSFVVNGEEDGDANSSPLAELFLEANVVFADLVVSANPE